MIYSLSSWEVLSWRLSELGVTRPHGVGGVGGGGANHQAVIPHVAVLRTCATCARNVVTLRGALARVRGCKYMYSAVNADHSIHTA